MLECYRHAAIPGPGELLLLHGRAGAFPVPTIFVGTRIPLRFKSPSPRGRGVWGEGRGVHNAGTACFSISALHWFHRITDCMNTLSGVARTTPCHLIMAFMFLQSDFSHILFSINTGKTWQYSLIVSLTFQTPKCSHRNE